MGGDGIGLIVSQRRYKRSWPQKASIDQERLENVVGCKGLTANQQRRKSRNPHVDDINHDS